MKLELDSFFTLQINYFYYTSLASDAAKTDQAPIAFVSMSSPDWRVKIFQGFLQGNNISAFGPFEVCLNNSAK